MQVQVCFFHVPSEIVENIKDGLACVQTCAASNDSLKRKDCIKRGFLVFFYFNFK